MIAKTGPSLYHVSIGSFLFPAHRQAIEAILSDVGDWLRYTENCWIVYGSGPILGWAQRLRAVPGLQAGSILIVDIGLEFSGYLTPEAWEWVRKYRPDSV
jgi:hypothetical protein